MKTQNETRSYGIPGDLDRLRAAGFVRPLPHTKETLYRMLRFLEPFLAEGAVPGLKGRRKDRNYYEVVPWPNELAYELEDVHAAMSACREALARDDYAKAREYAKRLDVILDVVRRRADPDRVRGMKQLQFAREGGKTRQGKRKSDTEAILAYVADGHSYGQAARKFGKTREAVKKLVQRHSKK